MSNLVEITKQEIDDAAREYLEESCSEYAFACGGHHYAANPVECFREGARWAIEKLAGMDVEEWSDDKITINI